MTVRDRRDRAPVHGFRGGSQANPRAISADGQRRGPGTYGGVHGAAPVGVVVGIIPLNYPAELFAHKIPGARAAGNSVIVKLPEQCPPTVLRLGAIFLEAGLRPEGMQMLTGNPQHMGDELLTHPEIRMVSFTGSAEAAKRIACKTASTLKRLAF